MERKKSSFSPLTLSGKDVMVNLIIRLTEVELTTGSIMDKSRPSGQKSSGQLSALFLWMNQSYDLSYETIS